MAAAAAIIWNYFQRQEEDPLGANCLLCSRTIQRGPSIDRLCASALWLHLRSKHYEAYHEAQQRRMREQAEAVEEVGAAGWE